jgi:CarboxypepD_reg-like domain/TonB-dependent Receptor Plug Domain
MKAFYLILLVLLWMGQVSAQESEKRISIQAQNKSLAKVLSEIEVQGAVRFSYNPRKINASQKINFNVGNATVEEALRALAETIKLEFTPIENQIIVNTYTKKGADRNETVTLSGYVKDLRNGEALIGATVYLPELETGTITNSYGFFSLTVPAGTYAVKVSYIGYQTSELSINLVASLKQDFALPEELSILEEVIITALPEASISETNVSQLSLPPKTIEERPALFGELDVIKSLESLPGIKLQSDGSTFYYVRGGNRDQNLILIDDSPIYNPSHLLGVFSTIIPDATTDITLYKGNMPASFGGRLSSVLDVHTRKGNDQFTQLWGNTGLISTKLGC